MDGSSTATAIVEIRDLAHGGEGVGTAVEGGGGEGEVEGKEGSGVGTPDARVWFVEGALPGERVRAGQTDAHKRWLRGHVLEVLTPSALRVTPPCPLAERCGGCSWQHVDPGASASLKAEIVKNQLRKLPVPEPGVVASPRALGYRRRARVHYARGTEHGQPSLDLGFYGKRTREVVDASHCPVLDPALDWAIQQLRSWAQWLPERGTVHGLSNGEEVVLGLQGVRHQAPLEAAIRELVDRTAAEDHQGPRLVGVQLRGGRERIGIGRTWLELDGDGPTPPVNQGPFTFSQAQAQQNAALVEHVVAMAEAGERRVLELHAGVGNFTRALARVARRVWTVDGDREAVANLRRTVERWGLPVNVKRGEAEKLLAKLRAGDRRYDVVVCDPPRAGIGRQAARDLAAVARERIVYVSCDPATLARDLEILLHEDAGFVCVDLRVFDMMPMTSEIEVVATLARGDGARGDGARGDGARGDGARGDGARGDGAGGSR